MNLVIIDNYDSFTWNLYDYFKQLTDNVAVFRNDEISIEDLALMEPAGIVLAPGPKNPTQTHNLFPIIEQFSKDIPLLGICLGHQGLGEYFGFKLIEANQPMHGKVSRIKHEQNGIFNGLPVPLEVMRYHSLILESTAKGLEHFNISASTDTGEIMAIEHKELPLIGVQFHPESILTNFGLKLLENWIQQYLTK